MDRLHPLHVIRVAKGLSREQAAERSGLSARGIYNIEAGVGSPTIATVQALADAYGVSFAAALGLPEIDVQSIVEAVVREVTAQLSESGEERG